MRSTTVVSSVFAAALLAAPAAGQAQEFEDDFEEFDDADDAGDEGGFGAEDSAAAGGGDGAGLGVGVQAMLESVVGPAVVYDAGGYHVEGILEFDTNGATVIGAGGRFYYHLHESQAADLSVGGGLGIIQVDDDGPMDNDETNVNLEGGAQIRMFLVPNVSLSAALGLAVVVGDADRVEIDGQLAGAFGITYFFQ